MNMGPLNNLGWEVAPSGAVLSRSAEPTREGWNALVFLHEAFRARAGLAPLTEEPLCHFALNGVKAPFGMSVVELAVVDWSVICPSVNAAVALGAAIAADLMSGRNCHVNCTRGEDRTGYLCGVVDLRFFQFTLAETLARRALFLSTPLLDQIMDHAIVTNLTSIATLAPARI